MKVKWYDTDFWQVALYVIGILLVAFFLSGCKTKYVPMEKVICRDVVKHDTLHTSDSVFVRDSIFLRQKGDTCFLNRWHEKTVFKNVYKVRVDSFLKRGSIPVPYPVEKQTLQVGAVSVEVCSMVFWSTLHAANRIRLQTL